MAAKIGTTIGVSGPGTVDVCLNISSAVLKRLIEEVLGSSNQQGARQFYKTENPSVGQLAEYYFNSGQFQAFLNRCPPSFSATEHVEIQEPQETVHL